MSDEEALTVLSALECVCSSREKNNTMTEAEVNEHCSQTEFAVQMTITSSFVSGYKSGQMRVMFIANGTQNCDGTSYA